MGADRHWEGKYNKDDLNQDITDVTLAHNTSGGHLTAQGSYGKMTLQEIFYFLRVGFPALLF